MRRLATLALLALAVAPWTGAAQSAPEVTGGPWLNSPPLSLAALRGRVVYVEFWTYG